MEGDTEQSEPYILILTLILTGNVSWQVPFPLGIINFPRYKLRGWV